ncbi:Transcription factor TFIIB cyclin-related protein [Halorubrum californiense DSM 19288]|uniref:Transcription factor TFIIB cyclin-related protein n=1 Tax=Halorubrum californiense DSM 19288 TaxID=1227465 RepID=M0EBF8_9EURY|nr:Transcription factor TFIIB cyclin-related protein [Halorubrum californiense DSM 19288]
MSTTEHTSQAGETTVSSTTDSCPDCGGTVRSQHHERVYTDCGLVVETDNLDRGPEWRSFDDDGETPARTGAPLTVARHDRGLSTEIGHKTDARGSTLTGPKRAQLFRLRREQVRSRFQSKADRNLADGLS